MTEIEGVLGPGGLLARAVPGYEDRPQQLSMARAVARALEERRYAVIEAGTGTGKTLAYLVPALLSGRRVVVSTATRTLQDQIFFKDLPLLSRTLGIDLEVAYMKGRTNYLCKARHEAFRKAPTFATREEAHYGTEIDRWAEVTESGDRAELPLPDAFLTWRDLSSSAETCVGTRCPHYEDCFVTRMRKRAAEADLVVVNHHLFFADLALKGEEGGGEVIPRYDAVIFDEAHALEEIATDYFGVQISNFRVEELLRDGAKALAGESTLAPILTPLLARVEGRAAGFFSAVEDATELPRTRGENAVVRLTRGQLGAASVEHGELDAALEELSAAGARAEEAPAVVAIGRRAENLRIDLGFAADVGADRGFVHFVERRGRGTFLRAAPIEVSGELRSRLYARCDAAVFTSATLTVGGSFEYVRARLGLDDSGEPAVDELPLGSPFDYKRQAALYLPRHLPEPVDPAYIDAVAGELFRLFELTSGRAFALFTSVRAMERAHALLSPSLPWQVLRQGELPKAQLLERFQSEPSVLFATASFWEGVDVPGEALSLVAIDRLPFASPGDPVVSARIDALKERGEDAFATYQVPQAAIALRQGFGRLVRSRADRGIVAILDRRIVTKGYGWRFLRSLPDCPRFSDLEGVRGFWEQATRSP